ncbi:MAG: glycosyltransferase family 39 protein [Anaerolineae bacterium]|nr:glycosyltransferase family 39 protein [Anaerolineae bacterium]
MAHNSGWWRSVALLMVMWWAALALWATRLAAPLTGRHDNNSAYHLVAGRAYWHYGWRVPALAPVMDTDPTLQTPARFYINHPPLGAWLAAAGVALWGDQPAAVRLIAMFGTLIAGAGLFLWLRRAFGAGVALVAQALFLALPVIAFYGQMLNHEPLALVFVGLLLPLYQRAQRRGRGWRWVSVCAALLLLSAWPGAFYVAACALHALFFTRTRLRARALLALAGGALAGLALWVVPTLLAFPAFVSLLSGQFLLRSGLSDNPWTGVVDYAWTMLWARTRPNVTEAGLLLAALGVALWLWRGAWRNADVALALCLFLPPLAQFVVFAGQSWRHDYTVYHLAPALAGSGAVALVWLWQRGRQGGRWRPAWMVLALLVLAFGVSSARRLTTLYSERDDFPLVIAPYIQAVVPPGQPLYTLANIGWTPAAWYYAQRQFITAEAVRPALAGVWLLCRAADPAPQPDEIAAGGLLCRFEDHRAG